MDSRSSNTTAAPDVNTNTELPVHHQRGPMHRRPSTPLGTGPDGQASFQTLVDIVSRIEQSQASMARSLEELNQLLRQDIWVHRGDLATNVLGAAASVAQAINC